MQRWQIRKRKSERVMTERCMHRASETESCHSPIFDLIPRNIIALARSAAIGNGHKSFLAHNFAHIFLVFSHLAYEYVRHTHSRKHWRIRVVG